MKEIAYKLILDRAAQYANQDARKPSYLGGDIFRPPNRYEHLELWYTPEVVNNGIRAARSLKSEHRSEEEVIRSLTVIVRDAVQQAIAEEPEAIGALIISEAREKDPRDWFN